MSKKLTPWFPGNVKPVRVGVYERNYKDTGEILCCYWCGDYWASAGMNHGDAVWRREIKSPIQSLPWRGLAAKP